MKTILKLPTTSISVDFKNKLAVGILIGDVTFQDYKEMLLAGAELARIGKIDSIIMDRREVNKLDAECRVWVKTEYLKHHVKPLIPKMRKVAVIQSKSILGQIYGQTIYKTLALFYPNLTFKSFAEIDEAKEWITPIEPKGNMVAEDFINEGNTTIDKENEALVASYSQKNEALMSRSSIIQQSIEKERVLKKAAEQKQSNSFFDKVFNALFKNNN